MEAPEIRLSPSIAKILIGNSALHAWSEHWLLGGNKRDPSPEMERGIILDALILGGSAKDRLFVVDAEDWRTKDAKTQRDQARLDGNVPVLAKKLVELQVVAGEISKRIADRGIVFDGETQKKVLWSKDGVLCKGKLDHYIKSDGLIFDLKCVEDASPAACKKAVTNFRYDIQEAAYVEGIETTEPEMLGRVNMAFLFCEVQPPFAMTVCQLSGTFKELGRSDWQRAVRTWGACLKANNWPDYGNDVVTLEPPTWALSQHQEEEILREFKMVHDLSPSKE